MDFVRAHIFHNGFAVRPFPKLVTWKDLKKRLLGPLGTPRLTLLHPTRVSTEAADRDAVVRNSL